MIYDYVHNPAEYDVEPRWWLVVDLSGEPVRPLRELTLDDPEVWMPVERAPHAYRVSSHGRVASVGRMVEFNYANQWGPSGRKATRHAPATILQPQSNGTGKYPQVSISRKSYKVHWLVAEAFLGFTPPGHVIRHIDDNGWHNAPANLTFGTYRQNSRDAYINRRRPLGRNTRGGADLTIEQASAIRALADTVSLARLARAFGRSSGAIASIHDGRTWRHAPVMSLQDAQLVLERAERA